MNPTPPPITNRKAILSLAAAALTVLAFCAGFLPIPFTALICYPISAALSLLALGMGLSALREIRQSAEAGRTMALIGIWLGALTLASVVCATTLAALLLPQLLDFIQKVWNQLPHR